MLVLLERVGVRGQWPQRVVCSLDERDPAQSGEEEGAYAGPAGGQSASDEPDVFVAATVVSNPLSHSAAPALWPELDCEEDAALVPEDRNAGVFEPSPGGEAGVA